MSTGRGRRCRPGMVAHRAIAALCLAFVGAGSAGCGEDSPTGNDDEGCTTGTYTLTPPSPATDYDVTEDYVFHSSAENEGAGPGCEDVAYFSCVSGVDGGYDYYRNAENVTTCVDQIFNSEVLKAVGNKRRFSMVGTWTTEGDGTAGAPFSASGTYTAADSTGAVVESGDFTFRIAVPVPAHNVHGP